MQKPEFPNPSGRFERNREGKTTFVPAPLPPELNYAGTIGLIAEAHGRLGVLAGLGQLLPNPHLLILPYITREAVSSSKIEGTEASMLDVFRFEADKNIDPEGRKRVQEVFNYVRALSSCIGQIGQGKQVDLAILRYAHKILLKDVRGQRVEPGKFRKVQNWIGHPGCDIEDALYVPPAAHLLDGLLADLITFIENPPPEMPVLVICALAHYQFESIHPFEDGNGRVGRLLIPLILASSRTLDRPLLYVSAYFERNRSEYYTRLRNVSKHSEWVEWVEFFLRGVIQCSKEAVDATNRFLELKSRYEQKLADEKASRNTIVLTSHLFSNPRITIPQAASYLEMGYPPAKKAVMYLVDAGILEQIGSRRRNKEYVAKEILDVFS